MNPEEPRFEVGNSERAGVGGGSGIPSLLISDRITCSASSVLSVSWLAAISISRLLFYRQCSSSVMVKAFLIQMG